MSLKITKRNEIDTNPFYDFPFFRMGKINTMMKSDILEKEKGYLIYIDMPGFEKNDIKVITNNDYLEIIAERKEEKEDNYLHQERFFGECSRKFYIGDGDKDNVKASYKSGVLELWIPKSEEDQEKSKYVEIN